MRAVAWAVLLFCTTGTVFAGEENLTFLLTPYDIGYTYSDFKNPLPKGWERRYLPYGGTMEAHNQPGVVHARVPVVGIEPSFGIARGVRLRFPITYAPLTRRYFFQRTVIDWWDPVFGNALAAWPTTPHFGITLEDKSGTGIGYQLVRYRFARLEFEGDDCWGCVNTSHEILREPLESQWGHRVSVTLFRRGDSSRDPSKFNGRLEFYYEYSGMRTHRLGCRLLTVALSVKPERRLE